MNPSTNPPTDPGADPSAYADVYADGTATVAPTSAIALSTTAKMLIAVLLAAAAAFVWINLFLRAPAGSVIPMPLRTAAPAPAIGSTAGSTRAPSALAAAGGDGAGALRPDVAPRPSAAAAPAAATADASSGAATEGVSVAPVAPIATPEAAPRLAELPFLVTEPLPFEDPAATDAGEPAAPPRPEARRASVNPFSPVLRPEVQAIAGATELAPDAVATPAAPAPGALTEVAIPAPPASSGAPAPMPAAPLADAPTPRPLAPPSPRASSLPRPLPSGTLPVAPDLLVATRSGTAPASTPPALVAPAREPAAPAPVLATAASARPASTTTDVADVPAPLVPGEVAAERTPSSSDSASDPLVAGVSELSRYLRDNNVRFTGSVLGPVGVGVFRSALGAAPVVISLGQPLPDTEIVLTDLRGQQAELTLGDTSQTLTLDLRR